jgi:hypothetical protein
MPRFPGKRRHLRRLYPDPMTGQADWVLLRQGDHIIGVRSRATGRPFKQAGFEKRDADFAGAASYADMALRCALRPRTGAVTPMSGNSGHRPTGSCRHFICR